MNLSTSKDWKEMTKNNYDQHAEEFASFTAVFRGKLQKWIEGFSSQFSKNSKILDIGCGAGRDALYFKNKGLSVTGIDFSEQLIEIAKEKVQGENFLIMDFENLSFPRNIFDGAWASASLLHIPKRRLLKTLKKINLVLKKNGLFFSSFRIGEGEKITKEKRGNAILKRFYAYYQPEEMETLLRKAGFKSIAYKTDAIVSGDWVGFFVRK